MKAISLRRRKRWHIFTVTKTGKQRHI
jgi:hypothetical protein